MSRRPPTEAKWPCKECGSATRVYDSRLTVRWRECKSCGLRFITHEVFDRLVLRSKNRREKLTSTNL